MQHEITHALGRVSYSWGTTGFDLYRYSAPGVWASTETAAAYLSIDGGMTSLGAFSMTGDRADWSGVMATDAQAAFLGTGIQFLYSQSDIIALNALGYAIDGSTSGAMTSSGLAVGGLDAAPTMAFAYDAVDIPGSAAWLADMDHGSDLGVTDLVPPPPTAARPLIARDVPMGLRAWDMADSRAWLTGSEAG